MCGYDEATGQFTISRAEFQTITYDKGLYFKEQPADPYLDGCDSMLIKDWEFDFVAVGQNEIECADILRRFEAMFEESPYEFINFTNGDISCRWSSIFAMNTAAERDEHRDLWRWEVSVRIVWCFK